MRKRRGRRRRTGLNFLRQALIPAAEAVKISSVREKAGKVGPDNECSEGSEQQLFIRTDQTMEGWKEKSRKLAFRSLKANKTSSAVSALIDHQGHECKETKQWLTDVKVVHSGSPQQVQAEAVGLSS